MKRIIYWTIFVLIIVAYVTDVENIDLKGLFSSPQTSSTSYDKVIYFPADRYPKTAAHIEHAIEEGKSAICTIDREGAEENRGQSLKGVPTRDGYDRDEFPMEFCDGGGTGADIDYVKPADNRGAGSWISHQVDEFPDGTKVLIQVK
ncbi:DNA-entry nuclease [Bacillus megaterium]|nr:NucA/NucB deoxyribonuclease domain-containing protein [Priestia megaterium]MBE2978458.1 DNA-entry nuclease [Priestia megaterium]